MQGRACYTGAQRMENPPMPPPPGRAAPARLLPARLLPRRLILGAIGTLPLLRSTAAQTAVAHRITLLHLNDFHSRHTLVDPRAMACQPGGSSCFGSSPRLATAIREQRRAATADGRTVFLLDAGDQFQGSLFYTAHHGLAELAVQHAVGTDAMAVGNHEFDNGPANLGRYVTRARFPVLSANIDASAEPSLANRLHPQVVLERDGFRLGLVGLTTREAQTSSSPGPNVRFTDPAEALPAAIAAARAQGAQLVVLLSHLGLPLDSTLTGPAVIIGGHTHTLLSNDEPGASGPHPTVSQGPLPRPLIVQAGAYGRYLGRLDLDLAADGTVLAYGGACRHIGPGLAEDPEVAAIVAAFAAPLEALRQRAITTLPNALDIAGCRIGACPFGTLVAATLRRAAHGTPADGATIGLMNAGGLRVGLAAGPLTLGQVLDALPYGNTLATATLTGADLVDTVIHGLTMAGRGGYAQWAGLRLNGLTIEVEAPNGSWGPIDPAARYLVATNNFVRSGGDGYNALRDRAINPYDTGPSVAELVADALSTQGRR